MDKLLTKTEQRALQKARDSMHVLPLAMIPLATPGLRKANLVKNAQLETALELFRSDVSGSGQVSPENLDDIFPANKAELEQDRAKIGALSTLGSFDVYSLRLGLQKLGIECTDPEFLTLSPDAKHELEVQMHEFTHPLLQQVYGEESTRIKNINDLMHAWEKPDNREEALENLRVMSKKLNLNLHDIPGFIEDYSDLFLSIAYFRNVLHKVSHDINEFIDWSKDIHDNKYLQEDQRLINSCQSVEKTLVQIIETLNGRLEKLNHKFSEFWEHIDTESFEEISKLVTDNHENIGAVLCSMSVKMQEWRDNFKPANDSSLPHKKAEFIMSEILPGLGQIKRMQDMAPQF